MFMKQRLLSLALLSMAFLSPRALTSDSLPNRHEELFKLDFSSPECSWWWPSDESDNDKKDTTQNNSPASSEERIKQKFERLKNLVQIFNEKVIGQ
jgi:hypothetical protein